MSADAAPEQTVARVRACYNALRETIAQVVIGQEDAVRLLATAMICGGHVLMIGVPGLAKTMMVRTLAKSLGWDFQRIQFTPDLMPSDITGTELLQSGDNGQRSLVFHRGPLFANLVLADEINRTPPKTQAALLEAMQERMVTVSGQTYPLPNPFVVVATQNPIEQEGTYPLPEAQLDRFLMQVNIDYPSVGAERQMMIATTSGAEAVPEQVLDGEQLMAMQALVRRLPVSESLIEAILALVRSGRPESSTVDGVREQVAWGPGPRASQSLMLVTRVRALLDGRLAPSLDDLRVLAAPVLRHRMAVTFAARADGISVDDVIERLVRQVG